MHKIILIATYHGKWPVFFPAFLASCSHNESIDWLILTDCPIPASPPPNVHFEAMQLAELNRVAGKKTGLNIAKGPYSQVDLKPAHGFMFSERLSGYEFWGTCDLDVVRGDIRAFITERHLKNYDVISSRLGKIAGYFTLWRNNDFVNTLFQRCPGYEAAFTNREWARFDEHVMSEFLACHPELGVRLCWDKRLVVGKPELDKQPSGWRWQDGRIYDSSGQERMYIHFLQWKRTIKSIDFDADMRPAAFRVCRRGIWQRPLPAKEIVYERLWHLRQRLKWTFTRPTFDDMPYEEPRGSWSKGRVLGGRSS